MIFIVIEIHLFKIRLTDVALIEIMKRILAMNQKIILRINKSENFISFNNRK